MPKIYHTFDDMFPPSKEYFDELERISKKRIVWGGNYFLEHLGSTQCLIIWDKGRRGMAFADAEVAWSDIKDSVRIFQYTWNGMLQGDMKNKEERIHPTQKPVALYEWILNRYAKKGDKILDTHVGSGSSRIAAYNLNFDFTGYEIDPVYYELQEKRFEAHTRQLRLF